MRILRLQCYEQHYNWVVRKAYGAKHQSARQSSECGGLVEDELDSLALDARQGLSHAPRVLERATSLEPAQAHPSTLVATPHDAQERDRDTRVTPVASSLSRRLSAQRRDCNRHSVTTNRVGDPVSKKKKLQHRQAQPQDPDDNVCNRIPSGPSCRALDASDKFAISALNHTPVARSLARTVQTHKHSKQAGNHHIYEDLSKLTKEQLDLVISANELLPLHLLVETHMDPKRKMSQGLDEEPAPWPQDAKRPCKASKGKGPVQKKSAKDTPHVMPYGCPGYSKECKEHKNRRWTSRAEFVRHFEDKHSKEFKSLSDLTKATPGMDDVKPGGTRYERAGHAEIDNFSHSDTGTDPFILDFFYLNDSLIGPVSGF
ncbi:hypothetical protein PSV08DRAFT_244970 [Bipolaris maydis]|uniref:uncharacterized protein n=1 Tax=Cochliobolus heterostrophus TaxID=5016 RepID=UPI0024D4459F|nr:hypothetical protein J3E73DRAFT_252349 [Bipolaris maydis]KAJ5060589.1 hypothetical protein J3E74DRAFT_290842 [Bipolaris maydis]KAJ6273773.1 hypothetical protein PSV08DRAFT_244970 [Bipolaris maydis]